MPHVGVIAIAESNHAPLAVPIWYSYEPRGDVVLLSGATSRKTRLLKAAGRFSLCVQQESLPYRYVMVEGPVVDVRTADLEADERPMAHRYLGTALGDRYCESLGDGGSDSLRFTMRPERWFSADYGRTG